MTSTKTSAQAAVTTTELANMGVFQAANYALGKLFSDFEDGILDADKTIVAQLKQRFRLDDAQEASLRIMLSNLKMLYGVGKEREAIKIYIYMCKQDVSDILSGHWRSINERLGKVCED